MYFQPLYDLARRAIALDEHAILNALLANPGLQQDILDLNRQNQLFDKGIDSTGRSLADIGGGYAPVTIQIKTAKGQPTDRVTLRDTGEFYASFYIVLGEKEFYIEADPMKPGGVNLLEEWGKDVLGLTDESKRQLVEWLKAEMVPVVRDYLLAA